VPNQALRADAERNRQQLVEAARIVLAERGLDAPLDEIARRAGVGNATLYRRFPTRRELVAAVFADALREVVEATERALDDPDPWAGFAGHLTFLCELQASNRGLADLLVSIPTGIAELKQLRGRAFSGLNRLIDRAKASGDLRADVGQQDVVLLLMANAGLIERTATAAPTAWRRHLGYVLAGLRNPVRAPAVPGPGQRQVTGAMRALAKRFGCG
jgi:AcrR family transcriptional regulator